MAKSRRRKVKPPPLGPTAEFVHVETPELVVIEDLEDVPEVVRGRFVKLAPRVPMSDRDTFDVSDLMQSLRDGGALAVVLAPVFLHDTQEARKVAEAMSDRRAVDIWFESQTIADPADLDGAKSLVLEFMDAEGL